MSTEAKCPFMHTAGGARSNRDWWPNQLNLKLLREFDPRTRASTTPRSSRASTWRP